MCNIIKIIVRYAKLFINVIEELWQSWNLFVGRRFREVHTHLEVNPRATYKMNNYWSYVRVKMMKIDCLLVSKKFCLSISGDILPPETIKWLYYLYNFNDLSIL